MLLQVRLRHLAQFPWYLDGDSLFDPIAVVLQKLPQAGLGIRFDTARWQKLRLQDDRNAARRANDDIRPQCRLAEDSLLLHASVIPPTRMLGPQHIQKPDIKGDFAGSGCLNIQLNPLWLRP